MGFATNGFVLRAPRTAPSNASTSGTANTGVVRDIKDLPASYDLPGDLVEADGDAYRAAVLENPSAADEEYLIWAANTSSLALVESPDFALTAEDPTAATRIPTGSLPVNDTTVPPAEDPTDGTARILVNDPGGRAIASVVSLTIKRGDNNNEVVITSFASQDADAGVVTLNAGTLSSLGGGVSRQRGDTAVEVIYIIAAARFWWTKNDRFGERFHWNGRTQRWEPIKGTSPRDLGFVAEGVNVQLAPRPTRFAVGDYLPGTPGNPDSLALVRVGVRPDAGAVVPEVLVVSDQEIEDGYSFTSVSPDAVVGVTNGILQWNDFDPVGPVKSFVLANQGRTVFYNPEQFDTESNGLVGLILGSDNDPLFLSPVPGPSDRPFVRLGFRRYLTPIAVDTEAELSAETPLEGEFAWARSTGQVKLSLFDIVKADPEDAGFDVNWLGNGVYYDGVAMNLRSQGTRAPVQLVDKDGNPDTVGAANHLFVPRAEPLPWPGVSGILHLPDGTGTAPDASGVPSYRPNGTGMVRRVLGAGDVILFTASGALEHIEIVDLESDLPDLPLFIRKGKAWLALEKGDGGSRVALGLKDRGRFVGEAMFLLQAEMLPGIYAEEARLYSREREAYTLAGDEVLRFAIDGAARTWTATGGGLGPFPTPQTYSAQEIADDINSQVAGSPASALNGRIVLSSPTAGTTNTGSVEIGYGTTANPTTFPDRELAGCAALGFLPGWRVDDPSTKTNWLPDNGVSFGLFRSPLNKDRSNTIADYKARDRFNSRLFSKAITGQPYFPLDNAPLQDVAGYDEDKFFLVAEGLNIALMENLVDVLYDFGNSRFAWLGQDSIRARIERATIALPLGQGGVVGITMNSLVAPGNGLYVAEDGGALVEQTFGTDFLLPGDGTQGIALLVEAFGNAIDVGSAGQFASGSTVFTDDNADFTNIDDPVLAGYRLRIIGGDAEGSYLVAADATSADTLVIESTVPFTADAGPDNGAPYATWSIHKGIPDTAYDPSVIADVVYEQFNHLLDEPFKMRLMHSTGAVPANPTAQSGSRLVAVLTEAVQRGRIINLRYGRESGSPEASLTGLTSIELGEIANSRLFAPPTDSHFASANFSIRVGRKLYPQGIGPTDVVTGVGSFAAPLTTDKIEYLLTTGELRFGSPTLEDREKAIVHYIQEFMDPALLAAGEAEYDSATGELNLSVADMTANVGETAYFVEQMITENALDVRLSPLIGAFAMSRPLRAGQLVEVSYYPADSNGNRATDEDNILLPQITEFLPLFVRLEEATRINATTYTFNPTGRTVDGDVDFVWVSSQLQNFGNATDVSFDGSLSILTFNDSVDIADTVELNYAVLEAFGGEVTYTTSTTPVWRPPFFLLAGQDTFTLNGDRTSLLVPGKLMRLGAQPFYIKESSYDAGANETSVVLFPTPELEAGSRAPGNDVLTLISSVPITTEVDGVPTGGSTGFILPILGAKFEPVDRGMLSFIFQGDFTRFAVAGHLLEVDGYPLLIVGGTLSEDGLTTRVDVSSPVLKGFSDLDTVKITARPIYPPDARLFLGVNPFVATEDTELVIFGETNHSGTVLPGRTLSPGVHYTADSTDGAITLLAPQMAPLGPSQKLLFSYTKVKRLSPFVANGVIEYPRYRAVYSYITTPTRRNGLLGAVLAATYSFRSPDSFFYRVTPMTEYLGEVTQILVARLSAQSPAGGAVITTGGATANSAQGNLALLAQRRDLFDQDRAARAFISFYNEAIVLFEQALETFDGTVIGDRDGKFRFFVGRDKTYNPPGYEDTISGLLNRRFIWGEVFLAANNSFGVTAEDPVVDPETAEQDATTLEVSGHPMDPFVLRFYVDEQDKIIGNDMDDFVLAGLARPNFILGALFPGVKMKGDFQRMWAPHRLSRLFPEATLVFTTLFPGLKADLENGDPGVYAFLKMLRPPRLFKKKDEEDDTSVFGSTFGKPIGVIANPALGVVQNITDADPRERLPRARIWAWYPEGSAELDDALGTTTVGKATVVATPLFLKDFPINPDTGFPDKTRFLSTGGAGDHDLPDLGTGDQELSTPPFKDWDDSVKPKIAMQLAFGRPTGETFGVGNANKKYKKILTGGGAGIELSSEVYGGVFVGTVQQGCVITLSDEKGADLVGGDVLALGSTDLSGSPVSLEQTDTIYVIPPGMNDSEMFGDPPTAEELEEIADNLPNYRRGFDMLVKKRGGNFADISLPSFKDPVPFGFKELLGQRPPLPMSTIEADLEFVNNARSPHNFPALQGLPTNDSGDFSIPYLNSGNTELDRLGAVAQDFVGIGQDDEASAPILGWAASPDEIVGNNGQITAAAVGLRPPATLLAADLSIVSPPDFTPVATAGSYTPHTGIGDVEQYDILMIERRPGNGVIPNSQGIIQIGDVTSSTIEPARFPTKTLDGTRFRYIINNAMVKIGGGGTAGMVVDEPGGVVTTFDITDFGGLFFNNGIGSGTAGGFNNIISNALFAFPNDNIIVIELIDPTSGTILETITIGGILGFGIAITGSLGTVLAATPPTFSDKVLTIPNVGFVDFTLLPGGGPPASRVDFKISVDTYNSNAASAGSSTGRINSDRLTFEEEFDLGSALPRGTVTIPGGVSVQCELDVLRVTADNRTSVRVNRAADMNGGALLTFLLRDTTTTVVGTFVPRPPGGELGTVKVMGFEGHLNQVITGTDISYTAIPSANENTLGVICEGEGVALDGLDAIVDDGAGILVSTAGSFGNIKAGDILIVEESKSGEGAIKAGTYLVRHTIEVDGATVGDHEVSASAAAGSSGWVKSTFPSVKSRAFSNGGNGTMTFSKVQTVPDSPSGYDWADSGEIYIIPNPTDLTTAVVCDYDSLSVNAKGLATIRLLNTTATDAAGAAITNEAFASAAAVGRTVSGMVFLPIGAYKAGFPPNNVVGDVDNVGVPTEQGFLHITIGNDNLGGTPKTWTQGTGADLVPTDSVTPPTATDLGIGRPVSLPDSKSFLPFKDAAVYANVTTYLDITRVTTAQWDGLHDGSGLITNCLVPGDKMVTNDSLDAAGTAGYYARAGVFLEPSWPQPVQDLGTVSGLGPHVVDAGNSPYVGLVGMRNVTDYASGSEEELKFKVRRLRRFHAQLDAAAANLDPLRFAYEIRRGVVDTYAPFTNPFIPGYVIGFIMTADTSGGAATQLGAFNNADVNVNAGDTIRILDASGNLLDTAEIASVSESSLLLRAPGFTEVAPGAVAGKAFEVFGKQAPVPQEQTNQQLYELIVDKVLFKQVAVPNSAGGKAEAFDELKDRDSAVNFTALPGGTAQIGDIVVVDSAGDLVGPTGPAILPERGVRPFGDTSVLGRPSHSSSGPDQLDDNRGFYRVTGVATDALTLSNLTEFSGAATVPVIFGAIDQEYAVLPTISAGLTGAINPDDPQEPQMALRPTAPAGTSGPDPNSYKGNKFSIEPFSYTIIRPSRLFSEEAVDLVLFMRERMFSWLEEMSTALQGNKNGNYFIFQQDNHITDVGSPDASGEGLGVMSNDFIHDLSGLVAVSPFENVSDCLSVLDRRYWVLDFRLDFEFPANTGSTTPYSSFDSDSPGIISDSMTAGSGRPVLPDRIEDVLDRGDRFRNLRLAWISFRADRVSGTLPSIVRFDEELPRRLQEQDDALRMQEGLDET